jgi:hypothetical protein
MWRSGPVHLRKGSCCKSFDRVRQSGPAGGFKTSHLALCSCHNICWPLSVLTRVASSTLCLFVLAPTHCGPSNLLLHNTDPVKVLLCSAQKWRNNQVLKPQLYSVWGASSPVSDADPYVKLILFSTYFRYSYSGGKFMHLHKSFLP